jgi:hypothetical protein
VFILPIRGVGDVRMLLVVVDSIAALDLSRVGIVRLKSVASFGIVVIDGGCSFYEHPLLAIVTLLSREPTARGETGFLFR